MVLRFVPYIGAVLAAALPISLAAAVGNDWTMTLWTVALFVVVEPLTGHVAEPLVCGRSAGLSPVAIVLAASFWTWLWGPLGLILSTPLTLCLVVLARHVDRLQFIDIMLGDKPALTPQQAAYQRMLTGDPIDAIEQARKFIKDKGAIAYYEEILVGALRLAQADAERGRLDDERLENIVQTVNEIVDDLSEHAANADTKNSKVAATGNVVTLNAAKTVSCLPGLGRLDACLILVIADVLKREGLNARVATALKSIEENQSPSVCLAYIEDVSAARIDYALRRIVREGHEAQVIVCLLGSSTDLGDGVNSEYPVARTLMENVAAVKEKGQVSSAAASVT
jgi:hypothetical protein